MGRYSNPSFRFPRKALQRSDRRANGLVPLCSLRGRSRSAAEIESCQRAPYARQERVFRPIGSPLESLLADSFEYRHFHPSERVFDRYRQYPFLPLRSPDQLVICRQEDIGVRSFSACDMKGVVGFDTHGFLNICCAVADACIKRHKLGRMTDHRPKTLKPLMICCAADFMIHDGTRYPNPFAEVYMPQNRNHSFGFEMDSILRLVVVGTIQATDIKVDARPTLHFQIEYRRIHHRSQASFSLGWQLLWVFFRSVMVRRA